MTSLGSPDGAVRSGSAHLDTFVLDNLPPPADWPRLDPLDYPARLNCAAELLGQADERPALWLESGEAISYAQLRERTNRLARRLVDELGLVPGGRVLLRGFNGPALVTAWLAVVQAGGVVVATMPLLRQRELAYVLEKARIPLALCDARLADELLPAADRTHARVVSYAALEDLLAPSADFSPVDTAAADPCLIAFTSGTTGQPKGAVHTHRDILAVCDTFSSRVLRPTADDVFCGTPPLAFTYGLGGMLLFPLRAGASAALQEKCTPETLLRHIQDRRCSILFTSPTMYRSLLGLVGQFDLSSLRSCVSAGEPLPLATYQEWLAATGLKIIDGIGATELLHIFISAAGDDIRPGATGRVVPGYEARVVDEQVRPLPPGQVGRLAVRGPTGCRYLADPERQRGYVQGGWNLTGDAYLQDQDGYFWFQARADDMIISAGYNIAGPEVENVLLEHPAVRECAVVAAPDAERGHIVKAFVVLREPAQAGPALVDELQRFVKAEIAPYKYPRAIEFLEALPHTETGKLQRYKLRQRELERASARAASA